MHYSDRLHQIQRAKKTHLCVGVDPDLERLPAHLLNAHTPAEAVLHFCRAIIGATASAASAFKFNFAFFEALGQEGPRVLAEVVGAVPEDVVTIADAKRGDIGNSARFYAKSVFDELGFDSVTVAPYMGEDAVAPFLDYPGKGVYILGRTSNQSSEDFQGLMVEGRPLYHHVVERVARWNAAYPGTAGLVAGATNVTALGDIGRLAPEAPLLIPGVGAQGGDPAAVMDACSVSSAPLLINSSRGIIYASAGPDFDAAAAKAAVALRDALRG